jgi:hypothetical protein
MAFNNGPRIITQGLSLMLDVADKNSYPGSGTTWIDTSGNNNTGTITGSVTYNTTYYGGLVFSGTSSAVLCPTTSLSYGTNNFTVEIAFSPSTINGIHYLASKSSGSFPSWNLYLSGSSGSGKLVSEFKYTTLISASVTSSYVYTTGSVYNVSIVPTIQGGVTFFYNNGTFINTGIPVGTSTSYTGSLSTGSVILAAANTSSVSQGFIGSLYTVKAYNTVFGNSKVITNYTIPQVRFNLPRILPLTSLGLDSDYLAVLAQATSLGYSLPNATQQIIDSNLITKLKACGYWNIAGDFYVFANPTSRDFARINWKRPSVSLSMPAAYTWTPGVGFTGDGAQSVSITPNASVIAGNSSFIAYTPSTFDSYFIRDGFNGNDGTKFGNVNGNQYYRQKVAPGNLSGPGFKAFSVSGSTAYFYNNNIFSTSTVSNTGIDATTYNLWTAACCPTAYVTTTLSVFGVGNAITNQGTDVYDAIAQYINYVS